ncbi:MAG TPA: aminoglycoside phosphotransferase family protein [Nocardioidaceae bacterium]|nr:aminoglycoside phosphotransferase family protein [Nocardioidaceae bacterium]
MSTFVVPDALEANRGLTPVWATWLDELPRRVADLLEEWELTVDGATMHGFCSVVLPVRTPGGRPAVLKVGIPDPEHENEHLALQHWKGNGTVQLLRADPRRFALLLERLHTEDLRELWDLEACEIVAGLYPRLHLPALPQLRTLSSFLEGWNDDLARLPRNAPVPRRLVEQALSLSRDFERDESTNGRIIHGDLHYYNVLAGDREPWLVIDPKPMSGDPHYEVAPMLWNRWDELDGQVRDGVRRRFHTLVDAAGFDEDRARDWVVVRMVHNAMWAFQDGDPHQWITTCISVAKAVQD